MKTFSLLCAFGFAFGALAQAGPPIPDEYKSGGFAIGCQAYSFNHYTVFEAIEKTAETGAKVIEFYPGQKLSKESPEISFSHDSPPEVIERVKAKLKEQKILAVAYGVVGIPQDEKGARKVFDFAKTMGLRVLNTESDKSIDMLQCFIGTSGHVQPAHKHFDARRAVTVRQRVSFPDLRGETGDCHCIEVSGKLVQSSRGRHFDIVHLHVVRGHACERQQS